MGLGENQVPEASITARARAVCRSPLASRQRMTNGAASRPSVVTLSSPSRPIAKTSASNTMCGAIAGCAASGSRYCSNDLAAGRQRLRVGRAPAGLFEQRVCCGVDVVPPGRENAHVAPGAQRVPDGRAALEQHGGQTALNEMRGGGQPHRPRTDDRNRQLSCGSPICRWLPDVCIKYTAYSCLSPFSGFVWNAPIARSPR